MRANLLLPIVLVLVLAVAPAIVGDYQAGVLDTMGIFAIVAIGLNLFSGSTGLFSLGHAGFYAIGAFTAAILGSQHGWPFWLQVPAGAVLAALVGLLVGIPVLRLSGPYLAIATLGFGLVVGDILNNADWAGGRTGITLAAPQLGSWTLNDRSFFWVILIALVAVTLVAYNLRRGATGRAFVALRESEPAAQASGIDVARYRVVAFSISAGVAGLAGALFANTFGYVSADSFSLPLSILFLAAIVFGGLDTIAGSILGAVALTLLREALQAQAQLADALYGAIIIAVLLFVPGGIMGLLYGATRRTGLQQLRAALEKPRG